MTSAIASITVDCEDALKASAFWAETLGVSADPDDRGSGAFFQSIGRTTEGWVGPIMMFIKVPEGKSAKNRIHLDLRTDDRPAEVARLLGLGATHVHDKDEWGTVWTTLLDPEGNEFCVSDALH
ncbi:MAG: VOC family protein [Acidimicrobiales bacterium]